MARGSRDIRYPAKATYRVQLFVEVTNAGQARRRKTASLSWYVPLDKLKPAKAARIISEALQAACPDISPARIRAFAAKASSLERRALLEADRRLYERISRRILGRR